MASANANSNPAPNSLENLVGTNSHLLPRDHPDPKKKPKLASWYNVEPNVFVTPKSHPGLFSFDGRWLAHRETFSASTWPGTSFKTLVHGSECTLKLRALRKEGKIENHRIYVAVDGTQQSMLSLPSYDAKKNQVFDLKVEFDKVNPSLNISSQSKEVQQVTTHVLEVMSDEASPVELVGISMVRHQVLRQGPNWLNDQNTIPHIEFVADKISSNTPPVNQTHMYTASRELGFRSSFVHLYDTCFTGNCGKIPTGLYQQYAWLSPFAKNPKPDDAREDIPTNYLFNPQQVFFPTTLPQWIVVDVGDNDLAKGVNGSDFTSHLQNFLGNIIVNYNPHANIIIIIRNDRYVTETENAIFSMRNPRINPVTFGEDTASWHKQLLCSYVGASVDPSSPVAAQCKGLVRQVGSQGDATSLARLFCILLGVCAFAGSVYAYVTYRHAVTLYIKSKYSSYTSVPTKQMTEV